VDREGDVPVERPPDSEAAWAVEVEAAVAVLPGILVKNPEASPLRILRTVEDAS